VFGQFRFYGNFLKRGIDFILSAVILMFCAPIMLAFAIALKLDSPGPTFFRQQRIGKDGKSFEILKLRTMRIDTEHLSFKTNEIDPRITRIGSLMRDTKIDELPQLFNVLRGDMSLIGPRPLSFDECKHIEEELGFTKDYPGFCPKVRPGITGLEQVNRRYFLPYKQRFEFNKFYEDNLSLWWDFKIFIKSIFACPAICGLTALAALFEFLVANRMI
jgi:lipopolysaccharide/colanic/teichoic acid biosynthesis glycosyltransferase